MATIIITLTIKDLKAVNIGNESFEYYLLVEYIDENVEITTCKNIVKGNGVFELKEGIRPTKIEIWDYNRRKIAGTLVVKKFDLNQGFKGSFKKANLSVEMSKPVIPKE